VFADLWNFRRRNLSVGSLSLLTAAVLTVTAVTPAGATARETQAEDRAVASAAGSTGAADSRRFEFVLEGADAHGGHQSAFATQRLAVGETGHLRVGEQATLRAVLGHLTERAVHPATRYRVVSGGDRIAILSTNEKHGELTLEGRREGVTVVTWEVYEPGLKLAKGSGRLELRVSAAATGSGNSSAPVSSGTATLEGKAESVVRGLYRGILMRDPDPGSATYVDKLRRSGWNGLDQVVREIAESDESHRGVYTRSGVCDPQRILALHKELLGHGENEIPRAEWDRQRDQFQARDYGDVAVELVHRAEFRSHFGITSY
jgi:hypothetical protein